MTCGTVQRVDDAQRNLIPGRDQVIEQVHAQHAQQAEHQELPPSPPSGPAYAPRSLAILAGRVRRRDSNRR